jgi:hypothetical protein
MDLAKRIALLAPVLVLLACGGSTTQVGNGGDGGPNSGCPSQAYVGSGGSCTAAGATCPGTVSIPNECGGGGGTTTSQCTCSNGDWQCPVLLTGGSGVGCPVPDPGCPDPSQVNPGNACSTSPQDSCNSSIPIPSCTGQPEGYVQCNCEQGMWACEEFGGPACPVEAGVCPDPSQVFDGQGCDTDGTTCQGDPQSCGGTTVYDTLQCYAGAWTLVAQTFCDEADAGVDAQFADGGQGI